MINSLPFALRFYGSQAFRIWCEELLSAGWNHGLRLTLIRSGADNVYACERLLVAAELEGWILRDEVSTPSPEQQFFGVGGFMGASQRSKPEAHRSPVEYRYRLGPSGDKLRSFVALRGSKLPSEK